MTPLDEPRVRLGASARGSSSGATSSVGADGQTGSALFDAAFAETYGSYDEALAELYPPQKARRAHLSGRTRRATTNGG